MDFYSSSQVKELDLHDMSVIEARRYLKSSINEMDKNVKEVMVIHGHRSGKKILNFIRNDFSHKRVEQKILDLNPGITILKLKKK